jgi:NADH-quinone oxidoreductase subunit L
MLVPLVILAVLSVIGGYIGVPAGLGGANRFEHFLAPVFNFTVIIRNEPPAHLEMLLMAAATAAGLAGLLLAWLFYVSRPELPRRVATAAGSLYQLVLNKYYVDEFYGAVFVRPLITGSARLLWRGIDATVIDGAIAGGARGAQEASGGVRRMQSGNLRSYAGWVAAGALAVLIYMLVMGGK